MNTKSSKPTASQTCARAKPLPQGVDAVALTLKALSLIPLHALAEGRNQSIPSLLHDMTGLSKARISQGNLDAIRPSTQVKVDRHLEKLLQDQFKGDPEGLHYFRSKISAAPETRSAKPAPLAGWVHQFEFLPWIPLPITKGVALTVDELLESLLIRCRNDDFRGFKCVLLAHFKHDGLPACGTGQTTTKPGLEDQLATLHSMSDWEQSSKWTRQFVDHLYWDLISCLDAEWNSHYFAGRQTRPLFPLVMVRAQEGLMETLKVASRRNILFKPVRRLLEFLYALAYYFRDKEWPPKAPKPETLSEILYRPGSRKSADKSLINNYFDGTTKVTLNLVLEHWDQLLHHFMSKYPESMRPGPPIPMIMLALQWQTLLVQDRGKSFLVPDMKSYEALWNLRRSQWSSLQAQQKDITIRQAGQSPKEAINWPAWSFSESSSSC